MKIKQLKITSLLKFFKEKNSPLAEKVWEPSPWQKINGRLEPQISSMIPPLKHNFIKHD